jgi:site-specific DNA-methyltransferase (adenine-specific)
MATPQYETITLICTDGGDCIDLDRNHRPTLPANHLHYATLVQQIGAAHAGALVQTDPVITIAFTTATAALAAAINLFIASNAFLSQLVFTALVEGGLEFRGELIRLVRTFWGGDRPKNAEEAFPEVCSMPRSCYEPWGLFRKPMPQGMKLSDCLREYGTGGLRRISIDQPFNDVIFSERTPRRERDIADHPSLKPQSFLRQIVRASLPLGQGVVLDPFMGSGSTVAAAQAQNIACIGVERFADYFELARDAIPRLAHLSVEDRMSQLSLLDVATHV